MDASDGAIGATYQMAVGQAMEHLKALRCHANRLAEEDVRRIARDLFWYIRTAGIDLAELETSHEELMAYGIDTDLLLN